MLKLKFLVVFALLAGCDSGSKSEVERLKREAADLKEENEALRRSLPSEKPAVLKELEDARQVIESLKRELNLANVAAAQAKVAAAQAASQVPPEMMPLATLVHDLKARVAELERTASRKGHTHEYMDKYPLNTFHSGTRTTAPEK